MRCFIFWSSINEESRPNVRSDFFKVIGSTLWHAMLSRKWTFSLRKQDAELIVVCASLVDQRCSPPKPEVKQHSSIRNLHTSTVFLQRVYEQLRLGFVPCNAIIDAMLIHCGNNGIDDRAPKRPFYFHTACLLTWDGGLNESKQLLKNLRMESEWSLEWRVGLFWKSECIWPAMQESLFAMHKIHIPRVEKMHSKATSQAGDNPHCRNAARQIGKDYPDWVKCGTIPTDAS